MKTIAILVPTIDSGGAEKQAVLLAARMSQYVNVHLIVLYGNHAESRSNLEILSESSVCIHKLTGNLLKKITSIYKNLKSCNTDVLFNYLSLPDVIGSFLGYCLNIRTYNGIRTTRLNYKKEFMERFAHNHWATGTIYNSFSGSMYFEKRGFNANKNIVITNCFPQIANPILRKEKKDKIIITVGRFDSSKDYETLIKSVSLLQRNDFKLCIVGYGALEEKIKGWVDEFGIKEKTVIHIKPNNVSELERNADVYISTSLFEGTSNSIMEALNWSLPVVATNVGDNDRLVIDGKNGFLHAIGDTRGIAESLSILLDSSDLRNKMGVKSNQILRENYSMEMFENRYIDLIEGKK